MKKVTIMDIASMTGVSKATVSMVLNKKDSCISDATRNRILKTAREMHYIPNSIARSLSTNKSGTIGIILPDITNPFFSEIARAIEDGANNRGYNVMFCNSDNNIKKEEKYIELMISKLVDGIIFISGGESRKNLERLTANNIPFVLVDRYVDGYENGYGVYCHNEEGVMQGIKYLYDKGKRKIAFAKGPKGLETSKNRLNGYKRAARQYGIYDSKLIFESDFTIEGGKAVTEYMLSSGTEFDSIFYSSDIMAFGGMKVLLRKGYKIPDDISIIGFDNIRISEFIEPELTTVAQPIYKMGNRSCELLIDIIEGAEISQKLIFFKPELIIRGTA